MDRALAHRGHMLGVLPGLQEDAFTLGNVAPDSGIPDKNWEHFDPPPKVTHFQPEDNSLYRCADLEFFRAYVLPDENLLSKEDFSIRLGYFFHLVTDNLWYLRIGKPAWEQSVHNSPPMLISGMRSKVIGMDWITPMSGTTLKACSGGFW